MARNPHKLTFREVAILLELFNKLDNDKNGNLDKLEVTRILDRIDNQGRPLSDAQKDLLMRMMDSGNRGFVSFKEFCNLLDSFSDIDKYLDILFHAFDINNDGIITEEELVAVGTLMVEGSDLAYEQELRAEFRRIDWNRNGSINLDEMKEAFKTKRNSYY